MRKTYSCSLAASVALLGLLIMPVATGAQTRPGVEPTQSVEAEFRGCESAGWCRFWIDSPASLIRVRPDGVPQTPDGDATSIAARNRLNALLANMIHQAKHIVLHDLHELDDGTFSATVTVTGVNLAVDPILVELREKANAVSR